MAVQFQASVKKLLTRKDMLVLVLRGAGEAFSGGGHLDMLFAKTKLPEKKNKEMAVRVVLHMQGALGV